MFLTPTEEGLLARMRARLGAPLPPVLGVAVSGGSDSLALLYLLARMAEECGNRLLVATVDHGLRAESRAEAETVALHAADLGLSHDILSWKEPTTEGNLQAAARAARYRLLSAWARAHGAAVVAVGHTADDQAETLLMRLRRASGVTGLAAMPTRQSRDGVEVLRPMLDLRREDLRRYLQDRGLAWAEDPSNFDQRFERVRMREALLALEPLGLTVEALSLVADNMCRAETALDLATRQAAGSLGEVRLGALRLAREGLGQLPEEITRRLVVKALRHVIGGEFPPRREALAEALASLGRGCGSTLLGCQILVRGRAVWICRETAAALRTPPLCIMPGSEVVWDNRWRITVPRDFAMCGATAKIGALGAEGLQRLDDWRSLGVPREVLMGLPTLWCTGVSPRLLPVSVPEGWTCAALRPPHTWDCGVLSH